MGRCSRFLKLLAGNACGSRTLVLLLALGTALPGCAGLPRREPAPDEALTTAAHGEESRVPPVPRFVDVAEQLGLRMTRVHAGTGRFYYPEFVGGAGALFDYDGDGWLDAYVVQGGPLPGFREQTPLRNRLYHNLEGRTFVDVTDQAGVDGTRDGKKLYTVGCAAGDFDNDGDEDLFVTGLGGCILYRSEGNGKFMDVTRAAGIRDTTFGSSAAFFDYDRDGKLDLLVCEYVDYRLGEDGSCLTPDKRRDYCRPNSYQPARSRLYHNLGGGRFHDVTEAAGLTRPGKALGVVIGDVDDDGDPDIYLACDLTPNLLYINQGDGKFTEEAVSRSCAVSENGQAQSGMGVDMADVDGDLLPDIWVANYYRENNNLYRNLGGGLFQDAAVTAPPGGGNRRQVCFGTGLVDLNNDSWPDVFVSNGHVLRYPDQVTPGAARAQTDQLFLNLGRGVFREASAEAGAWFTRKHVGRGVAFGDFDNDGDVDVLSVPNEGPVALLRNDGGNKGNWLTLRLQGTAGNRDGIGARLELTCGGRTVRQEVRSAYSYCCANDVRAHFGLGAASWAEKITIRWPGGRLQQLSGVAANHVYIVVEGEGIR